MSSRFSTLFSTFFRFDRENIGVVFADVGFAISFGAALRAGAATTASTLQKQNYKQKKKKNFFFEYAGAGGALGISGPEPAGFAATAAVTDSTTCTTRLQK
jgi:hypothetical protein